MSSFMKSSGGGGGVCVLTRERKIMSLFEMTFKRIFKKKTQTKLKNPLVVRLVTLERSQFAKNMFVVCGEEEFSFFIQTASLVLVEDKKSSAFILRRCSTI